MRTARTFDLLALAGVCLTLVMAFYYQIVLGELPCALCNLQRLGFMVFGAGLLLNVRFGTSPWNHVLSAVGALFGSLTALLQVFVHVLPGTPPTGTAFFGLHMYDWTYVVLTGALVYCVLALAFQAASGRTRACEDPTWRPPGAGPVSAVFILLVSANLVSAFLENGFEPFKSGGQLHYRMLYDGDIMKP
ncbi:disulfide bond formation protein B [Aquabacter cavernae]|uniref:disulfide bond formation protein B n=1 Tax=Aquabacter cavernae TaxID=2496029 RepID=UPI000F8D6BD4|nr:disulfide bond formation protein B [Aquabacter cavernae]